ncbi:MAG: hypothetical protein H7070_06285 [Saprospiraceae bacterium]|nr:hypothetical protein [Pyrinomonadaceae bacterium]
MKILRQLIFTFVAIAGLTLAVSAQKNSNQQKPPKEKPPVINPGDKKPKPPKEDKPKKPGMSYFVTGKKIVHDMV